MDAPSRPVIMMVPTDAVLARAIRTSSEAGQLVLDPFSGSGTCLLAAHQTDRACAAMDLDPRFVAVALERLTLAGLTPVLVG